MYKKAGQNGSVASMLVIVLLALALAGALGAAYWAYNGRQDYKNNSDKKSAQAVATALAAQKAQLQTDFDNQAKSPYKTYTGPTTYGTVSFQYPKTWSAYVDESSAVEPINGYFYPDRVPGLQSGQAFALRIELVGTAYAQAIQTFSAQTKLGKLTAAALIPPKMVGVPNTQPGTRFDGALTLNLTGSLLAIKVRDKTLEISTQSRDFISDFNNIILPSLTFVP